MVKKLYVGGLSYGTTEDALHDLFSQAGQVDSVKVIVDRDTGRSKGFAFVEMSTDAAAQDAISKYDGKEFDGRRLTVNEAKPQAPRPAGGPQRNRW
ncbi:MAG: RNA-binding protein [Proteobacteria bacterium]|nr:MAG: RNA-binding protein [Pseudomonadota bacterium]